VARSRVTTSTIESPASPLASRGTARDEGNPFTKIRRLTAEHMVRFKGHVGPPLMGEGVDYEQVELVRADWARIQRATRLSLSYLPFNAIAAIEALATFRDSTRRLVT